MPAKARVFADNRVLVASKARRVVAAHISTAARETATLARSQARVRTGYMRANTQREPRMRDDKVIRSLVVSSAYYSRFIEHGTSRAGAYPFLVPAFRTVAPRFVARLRAAFTPGLVRRY